MRSAMARPTSARSPLVQRGHERAQIAGVGDDVGQREGAAGELRARLGRRDLAVRVDDDDEQAVGDRQPHQVERVVAPDEHDAAQHGRGDVVGVGRPARRALAGHGALHEGVRGERASQGLVGRDRAGRRRRAGAAQPARERHPLLAATRRRPATPPSAAARRSTSAAATLAALRAASRGSAPPSPVTPASSTPGRSDTSTSTTSPGRCKASPSTSNPGPRFDTVAGANTRTRDLLAAIIAGHVSPVASPWSRSPWLAVT